MEHCKRLASYSLYGIKDCLAEKLWTLQQVDISK